MDLTRRIRSLEASPPRAGTEELDAEIEGLLAEVEARDGPETVERLLAEVAAAVDRPAWRR